MIPDTPPGRETACGNRDAARGQTAQDFAVGIGLFLLAVAFVFALVPYIVAPYDAGAGASEYAQADRAATSIVGNLSVDDRPNELANESTTQYFAAVGADSDELQNRTGLPFTARLNVTVTNVSSDQAVHASDPAPTWTAGATYRDGLGGASATRIVRTDEPNQCEPSCRVTVRVW